MVGGKELRRNRQSALNWQSEVNWNYFSSLCYTDLTCQIKKNKAKQIFLLEVLSAFISLKVPLYQFACL